MDPESPPASRPATRSTTVAAGRVVAWTFVALLATAVVVLTVDVLFVLFAGALFAVVLHGCASWLAEKTKLRYGLVLTTLVLVGLAATVVAVIVLAPTVESQFQTLVRDLPAALQKLRDKLHHTPIVEKTVGPQNVEKLQPEMKGLAGAALGALGGTLEVLGGFAVIFFVGVYGAAKPGEYVRAVLALTPKRHRRRMQNALDVARANLTRWLLGRLVAMLFVGVSTAIAFSLLKVPLALTLAALAGLLTFVEYIGAIASAIPPALLAFTRSPIDALWVLVVYTVLHVIEGYVLTPLLARKSVRLPPAITLGTQLLMEMLVGPLGLTFSTPLLVVGVSVVKGWRAAEEVLPMEDRLEQEERKERAEQTERGGGRQGPTRAAPLRPSRSGHLA